jgi:hypothetical protein
MTAGSEEEMIKNDIRDAEGRLVDTIREIRARVSYEALKNRALAQVHEVAVEKPKRLATDAAHGAYDYMHRGQAVMREQPILPLMIGIAILMPIFLRRIMRRRG